MNNEVLTLQEASEFLKLSKSTLYNLARKGKIPARRVGRSWRFVRFSLLEWLQTSKNNNNTHS